MAKISNSLALTMAEEVRSILYKNRMKGRDAFKASIEKSQAFKKLKALRKQQEEISKQAAEIELELEKGSKDLAVDISQRNGDFTNLSVSTRAIKITSETLQREIILASHVDGIPEAKIIPMFVKKYENHPDA